LTITESIAFGSLFIAIVSFLIALKSYSLANKSFHLSKKEHHDRYLSVKPYLIDAIKWSDGKEDYVSFAVSYTNEATIPNSLKEINLQLDFYDSDNMLKTAKIDPTMNVSPVNLLENYKILDLPITLMDKETQSGWITFKLTKSIWKQYKVDVYRLNAITASNDSISVESHLIKEV